MNPNVSGLRAAGRAALIVAAILACLCGSSANATPVPGPEFQIGGTLVNTPYNQETPNVAAGGPGYLVVWSDKRSGISNDCDVYGAFLDSDGHPTGGESFLISSLDGGPATFDQKTPSVAFNGTNFLVAWGDRRASNELSHIYGARVSLNGVVLDPNGFTISATGNAEQFAPMVASNGTDWEVTWQELPVGGSLDVCAARVSKTATVYSTVRVAGTSSNEQYPTIAWNGTYYLVAWEGYGSDATAYDVFFQRLTSTGSLTGSQTPVCSAVGDQKHLSIAVASAGTSVLTWQDARSGGLDVYAARVSSGGAVLDAGGVPINQAGNNQETPTVSWDGDYALVVWREHSNYLVRGARFTVPASSGQSMQVLDSSGFTISTSTVGIYGPVVNSMGRGSYVVAWYNSGISQVDISAAKVTSAKVVSPEVVVSLSHQDQPSSATAFDGTNFVTVWSDARDGVYAIYAARISQSGVVLDPEGVSVAAPSADQVEPSIAWNGTCYLVVWAEGNESAELQDLKGIRLGPDLTKLDVVPFTISAGTNNQNQPAVSWSGANFLVVWKDNKDANSPSYWSDIRGARVSPAGIVLAPSSIAVCTSTGSQYKPTVSSIGGAWLVAWEDDGYVNQGGGDLNPTRAQGIYCARITSSGTNQDGTTPKLVSSAATSKQTPSIAADDTNYMIVWASNAINISGVRMTTAAVRVDASDIDICAATGVQNNPSIVWAGDNYYVGWEDYRTWSTSGADVYVARVSSAGSVVDSGGLKVSGGSCGELKPVLTAAGSGWVGVFYDDFLFYVNRVAGRMFGEQAAETVDTINDAKARPDRSWVTLTSKVATAGTDQLGAGVFYIEDARPIPGLRVVTSSTVHESDLVTVTGRIDVVAGERTITASQVSVGTQGTVPSPVAMANVSIGGGQRSPTQPGVTNGFGAPNLGLLVRVWGYVTYVGGASENFFYIDDGKHWNDYSGHIGVKVYCGLGAKPLINKLVTVVGISSCEPSGSTSIRRILARKSEDIVTIP